MSVQLHTIARQKGHSYIDISYFDNSNLLSIKHIVKMDMKTRKMLLLFPKSLLNSCLTKRTKTRNASDRFRGAAVGNCIPDVSVKQCHILDM